MKRRDLLKSASLGIGAISVNSLPDWLRAASERTEKKVDVLVIGGGTAGTIAALQAAKAGARTMVVEMSGQLGGTTTTAGVNYPGLFHAWEKQIIAGLGWDLVVKAVEQHDAMIAAIEGGEGALAIDLTIQHWDLSRDRMERFVRPTPLPVDVIPFTDRQNAI